MDVFTKLFGEFLVFVYHCFDRIVIHGYLTALSRPELVVHFFRGIVGVAEVSKEALSQRTNDYQRGGSLCAQSFEPDRMGREGVRKEDHVLPWLRRMARRDAYGVYFIFKSMEQGPTYRVSLPKYPSKDPHYRIIAHQRSRFTHYDFYIRDEVLGRWFWRWPVPPVRDHLSPERSQLHRARAEAGWDRLPQARQRLPCRRRSGGPAGGGRPAEPGHHRRWLD